MGDLADVATGDLITAQRQNDITDYLEHGTHRINTLNVISTATIGTQPYACTSTTANTNLNADLLDGSHASAFSLSPHAIDGASHSSTLEDTQFEGTAATASNTTPSTIQTQWASKTGTARKVLVFDTTTGKPKWDYLMVYEVFSPAQILTFTMSGNGTGDDVVTSNQKLWGRNAGTWSFAMTYQGTPAAPTTIDSDTENIASDYPVTVTTPFTSYSGSPAINSPATVNSAITWTLSATVDSQTLTKTVAVTYRNRRHWGTNTNTSYTSALINAEDNEELTNSRVKTFTVTAATNEYIWYSYPSRLGTATFKVGGFEGGFESPQTINHTNDGSKVEDYYAYRSTNHSLGATTVEVT